MLSLDAWNLRFDRSFAQLFTRSGGQLLLLHEVVRDCVKQVVTITEPPVVTFAGLTDAEADLAKIIVEEAAMRALYEASLLERN